MRLVVWETENTPCMDVEDMSDYYINCFIDPKNKQSTDVHFRCEKGNPASFNWRIVLPITANSDDEDHILSFNLMDNDFFSPDDYAAGNSINLRRIVSDVYNLDVPIKFNKAYYEGLGYKDENLEFEDNDKFWYVMKKPDGVSGIYIMIINMIFIYDFIFIMILTNFNVISQLERAVINVEFS